MGNYRKPKCRTIINDDFRAEMAAAADPELQAKARKRITLYGEFRRSPPKAISWQEALLAEDRALYGDIPDFFGEGEAA